MGAVDPARIIPPPLHGRTVVHWVTALTAAAVLLALTIAAVDARSRPAPLEPDRLLVEHQMVIDTHAERGDCTALAAEVRSGRADPGVPATEQHTRTALVVEYALGAMHRIGCPAAADVSAPEPDGPMAGTNRVARF